MDEAVKKYDRVIMGIDPGTNVMGYAVLGVTGKTPRNGGYGRHQAQQDREPLYAAGAHL